MESKKDKKRFDEIHQFIIEIAAGNFSFKLELGDKQDEVETLVMLLNMMAEEVRSLLFQINPEESIRDIQQMVYILDQDLNIVGFSSSAPVFLEYQKENLFEIPFEHLLSSNSGNEFLTKVNQIKNAKKHSLGLKVKLEFKSLNSLIIPVEGFIHILHSNPEEERFLITAFNTIYWNKALEDLWNASVSEENLILHPTENQMLRLESYRKLFKKLHFYINQNLDRPLPSLHEIATQMGASESKLKRGFKKMYGISIFNFHREKRLEKAVMLITNTEQSIKQVSLDCGFTSLSHFSRTFKKRFGCSPSQIRNS